MTSSSGENQSLNSKVVTYFMILYPMMLSLGIGGSIGGLFWWLYGLLHQKVMSSFVVSLQIKYDDDTFKWVNKYMRDKGLIKEEGALQVKVKKERGPWWEEIFKPKDDKAKPEIEYLAGPGSHLMIFKGHKIWSSYHEGETLMTGHDRRPTK